MIVLLAAGVGMGASDSDAATAVVPMLPLVGVGQ